MEWNLPETVHSEEAAKNLRKITFLPTCEVIEDQAIPMVVSNRFLFPF